ncbi:hypothetical protein GCM10028774_45530 [Spirosoma jeollabukense]
MRTKERNAAIIDERLYSKEFRDTLIADPVMQRKMQDGKDLAKSIKKAKPNRA